MGNFLQSYLINTVSELKSDVTLKQCAIWVKLWIKKRVETRLKKIFKKNQTRDKSKNLICFSLEESTSH